MSEPPSHPPFGCEAIDSFYPGTALRRVPVHDYHNTTTDEAQSTTFPVPPEEINGSHIVGIWDDIQGLYKYLQIDTLNLPPTLLLNENYSQNSTLALNGMSSTPNINHNPHPSVGRRNNSVSSDYSGDITLQPNEHSNESVLFQMSLDTNLMNSNHSSFANVEPSPNYTCEQQFQSFESHQSSFSSNSSYSSATEIRFPSPYSYQETQDAQTLPERDTTFYHESLKSGEMELPTPEETGTETHTSAQHLETGSSMFSSPPVQVGTFSPEQRMKADSLFPQSAKRERPAEGKKGTKPFANRPPKKAKVLKQFPSVCDFVYDPSHEYDPVIKPTSAGMAMLMSCLKPTKRGQEMVLKENKRHLWQSKPNQKPHSYVDRILNSRILVALLFKSKKGPIACNHCNLKFENHLALAGHFDQYNISRPGRCEVEDCLSSVIGFASPSEQSRHKKTQHGGKAYPCTDSCSYSSPRLDCLKRHYWFFHEEKAKAGHIKFLPKEARPIEDLPKKFQDGKKSKTLTEEELYYLVQPILDKLQKLKLQELKELKEVP
ncbi:hypothetical protein CJU90_4479 [Yarrowia sp. C11]|nr:hypothetical protein CJU90_4479 [Yarrowia sp. C11]KAG5370430.1 hypothetical protein CKK34_0529 [Yarrowia sp. E02]